jgi:hypothetical protein
LTGFNHNGDAAALPSRSACHYATRVRLLGWASRGVAVVLPAGEALAVFDRARRFDVESGGRFDVRNCRAIVLWSEHAHPDGGRTEPVGSLRFTWDSPDDGHATLARVAWAEDAGTTEADLWRALNVLRGRG